MFEDVRARIGTLLLAAQKNMLSCSRGRVAGKKLAERLDTVSQLIRLPLPSDRSCNQTPMKGRWQTAPGTYLTPDDRRYATEEECLAIEARLSAEVLEFQGFESLTDAEVAVAQEVLGRNLRRNSAVCFQTGEPLRLADLANAALLSTNQLGTAELPVEYRMDLREGGRHERSNVGWIRPATEIMVLRAILEKSGVPAALMDKVQLKAYSTDKVTMPPHFSNRDYRWATWVDSIQFASRSDCRGVELQLLSQMTEFVGAPRLSPDDRQLVEDHLKRPLQIDGCKCPITGDPINYAEFVEDASNPKAGKSAFHVGHLDPLTRGGKHSWANVVWMSDAGNRIQGNDRFDDIVALIQRAATYHSQRRS